MVLLVMGVTASGKTTIGQALAQRLEWIFADGDDYHSLANREKMQDNVPLTDEDRKPWLIELHGLIADWVENRINGVLACSALKQQYRDLLAADLPESEVRFVFLDAPRDLIEERAAHRHHAFANPGMVASQLEILEPPPDALRIPLEVPEGTPKTVDEVVSEIMERLALKSAQEFRAEA
jgi:gluconokinase